MGITRFGLVIAILFLVAFPALADERRQDEGQGKAKEHSAEGPSVAARVGEDGIQRAEIIGGDYYFDPRQVIVKVNRPVELKVRKTPGRVPHNITVKAPEAGIDFSMELKEEPMTVRFTPTKVGKYPMFCDKKLLWLESHRQKGMEGVIEVVE